MDDYNELQALLDMIENDSELNNETMGMYIYSAYV